MDPYLYVAAGLVLGAILGFVANVRMYLRGLRTFEDAGQALREAKEIRKAWERFRLPDYVLRAAEEETTRAATMDAGGEYKRHNVLSALQRRYPKTRTRDLALAIEMVLH